MKTRRMRPWEVLAVLILVGLAISRAPAQSSSLSMNFYLLTAPHAAVGAPMKYQLVVTNTGTTSLTVTSTVSLIDPSGVSHTVSSTKPTLTAGQSKTSIVTFVTSKYSTQTGGFTLSATVTSGSTTLAQQTIPLTVVAVPANGVYASVGGQGPASSLIGATADYQFVVANLGTSSMSLKTNTTLVLTDGTQESLTTGSSVTISSGANVITAGEVTTTQYSGTTGNYNVVVTVLDSSNNVAATDTFTLTRNALPVTYYPPSFTDSATQAGITATRAGMAKPAGCGNFQDFMMGGGGVAVADYDGDGYDDIYQVDMTGMGHLWHNNQNGTFTDMAAQAGIPMVMMQSGASWADIDNDGYPDLLILTFVSQNVLLHNNGNGTFTDITSTSGLATPVNQNFVSATWGDYDNDGLLDLYIAVHADCNQQNTNDHLYHNNGSGSFTDVTSLLGGPTAPQVTGHGLIPAFIDYNHDGRPDIYLGNDEGKNFYPNVLWRNDGPGGANGWIFTDVSAATGANVKISDMGLAFTDYLRNGGFNIVASDVGTNVLLQQQSNGNFAREEGDGVGGAHIARITIPNPKASGTTFAIDWNMGTYDFNNDGWEDIFAVGGNIAAGPAIYPSAMFVNNQDGTFLDLSVLSGTTSVLAQMPGTAFADFNHDGFMDFFEMGMTGPPHLFMNNGLSQGNPNHWLEVKLVGTLSNKDAVGAHLVASVGGVNLQRWVVNTGYQGNSTLVQHFGLGSATQVDTLTVTWPSGMVQTLNNVQANQRLVVTEP